MRITFLIVISSVLLISGCDQANVMKKLTPPEAESAAKKYIELLRDKKFEEIEKNLDPSMKGQDVRKMLTKMAEAIPAKNPDTVKVVSLQATKRSDVSTTNITFEYQFQRDWFLINVATEKKGDSTTIVGFNVNTIPDSLEQLTKFTIKEKTPLQYTFLVMAIIIPLFVIYSLVLCLRTDIDKFKWLWIAFVMLGFVKFSINWTTGGWAVAPFSVLLFGVGAYAPPYGSWVISFSLPVGAIIFILKRNGFSRQQNQSEIICQLAHTSPEKEKWF